MDFSDRLKQIRKDNDITQEALAEKIGVARSNISKYESGQLDVSTDVLVALARVLHVTTDYLLGGSEEDLKIQLYLDDVFHDLDNEGKNFLKKLISEQYDIAVLYQPATYESLTQALGRCNRKNSTPSELINNIKLFDHAKSLGLSEEDIRVALEFAAKMKKKP